MAAHVAAETKRPFHCSTCGWGRHCDDSRPAPFVQWQITFRGEVIYESRTCPLPKVQPWAHEMVALYHHYRHSVFPFAGGLLEQPAFYKRAMETLDAAFTEIDAARVAKAAKGRDP